MLYFNLLYFCGIRHISTTSKRNRSPVSSSLEWVALYLLVSRLREAIYNGEYTPFQLCRTTPLLTDSKYDRYVVKYCIVTRRRRPHVIIAGDKEGPYVVRLALARHWQSLSRLTFCDSLAPFLAFSKLLLFFYKSYHLFNNQQES